MLDIRLADADDAQAIHLILKEVWGESLLFDVFIESISSSLHQVLVAVEDGEIAGFLSAFLVAGQSPRWEIDILAARPKSQAKGIGTSLIKETLIRGSKLGAHQARAVIRVGNDASQRAFSNTGFATDSQARKLLLWEPSACESVNSTPKAVHLIPVNTLTYRGLWIEGFCGVQLPLIEQHNVICSARSRIFHENRLYTGMFVPDDLKEIIASELETVATYGGQYHWWERAYK